MSFLEELGWANKQTESMPVTVSVQSVVPSCSCIVRNWINGVLYDVIMVHVSIIRRVLCQVPDWKIQSRRRRQHSQIIGIRSTCVFCICLSNVTKCKTKSVSKFSASTKTSNSETQFRGKYVAWWCNILSYNTNNQVDAIAIIIALLD